MSNDKDEKKKKQPSWSQVVRDFVGIIAGFSSLTLAMAYVLGRVYSEGYFSAMNISIFQLTLPIHEYAEIGWLFLLVSGFIVILVFDSLVFIRILTNLFIESWVRSKLDALIDKARKRWHPKIWEYDKALDERLSRISWFTLITLVAFFALFKATGWLINWATEVGETIGREQVTQRTQRISLSSASLLQIPGQHIENDSLYVYEGLRLLTFNEGHYFLFRDIDPKTCKPEEVYVVREEDLLSVTIHSAEPLMPDCEPGNLISAEPSPTPLPPTTELPTPEQ